MAQQPPAAEGRWVDIFTSGHEGYGDARRSVRQYSYNRVFGPIDMRTPGEIAVGSPPIQLAGDTFASATPCPFLKEWEDTVPDPVLLFGVADLIYTNKAGVFLQSATLGATITAGELHDDGSGVPYLYCALGGAGSTKVKRRNRAGTITACTNLVAEKLLSLNNDLYITATPSGGTAICGVGKVPAGTDPASAAQPSLTVVGFPTTKINNLVADGEGRAAIALKAEGILGYDRALAVWRPIGHIQFHPDNGKVYWYEQGDLCVGLGDGGAVRVHGTQLIPWNPLPDSASPDESTTSQVIAAAATLQNGAILVTRAPAKRIGGGGTGPSGDAGTVDVGKTSDNGATYTDYTTAVSDLDPTTYADLSSLSTLANGDWWVIGYPLPFVAVILDILAANTTTGAVTVQIWTGAWTTVTATDLTGKVGGSVTALSRTDGHAAIGLYAADPVVAGWIQSSLDVGGAKTRYWMRISYAGGLSATVKIKGVKVTPWRPPMVMSSSSALPAAVRTDGLDRAGVYPHVLYSHVDESGRHVTHDLGAIYTAADVIEAAIYATAGAGNGGIYHNGRDRSLVFIGMAHAYLMDFYERLTDEPLPSQDTFGGLVEFPSVDLGGPARLEEIEIAGHSWEATGWLFHRYDDDRAWSRATQFDNVPHRIGVSSDGAGTALKMALVIKPTYEYGTRRSKVTRIRARVVDVDKAPASLPAQTPPVI